MIEKVKEIYREWEAKASEELGWINCSMAAEKRREELEDDLAQQICQLFPKPHELRYYPEIDNPDEEEPKPDEGRLEEFFGLHHAELDGIMMGVLKQVASIKDAECQERVERILDGLISEMKRLSVELQKLRLERPTDLEGHKVLRSKKRSIQLAIGIVKKE